MAAVEIEGFLPPQEFQNPGFRKEAGVLYIARVARELQRSSLAAIKMKEAPRVSAALSCN